MVRYKKRDLMRSSLRRSHHHLCEGELLDNSPSNKRFIYNTQKGAGIVGFDNPTATADGEHEGGSA